MLMQIIKARLRLGQCHPQRTMPIRITPTRVT